MSNYHWHGRNYKYQNTWIYTRQNDEHQHRWLFKSKMSDFFFEEVKESSFLYSYIDPVRHAFWTDEDSDSELIKWIGSPQPLTENQLDRVIFRHKWMETDFYNDHMLVCMLYWLKLPETVYSRSFLDLMLLSDDIL